MESVFEGRVSDSPYIQMVWRGRTGSNYTPVCPADEHWNILFTRHQDVTRVCVEGPLNKAIAKTQPEGMEWLVIRFKLGTFIPYIPIGNLLNGGAATLPEAAGKSFWLNSSAWRFPDYDNVETFVDWMVRDGALICDPIVNAVIQDQPPAMSFRNVRRRFLRATGLPQTTIRQIERARHAVTLLQHGVPILDTVYQAGYADQPHMTRSLKHFTGQTPSQIVRFVQDTAPSTGL